MVPIMNIKRICLVTMKIDFRNGHSGLLGEAYRLGLAPYQGDMLVFIGRRKDRLKILFADHNGLWIWYKLFQKGTLYKRFQFLSDPKIIDVSPTQVMNLIEGGEWSQRKKE
jgi:transposase